MQPNVWESALNAVAPYDFSLELPGGARTFIDVKATTGRFEGKVHISIAELDHMCSGGTEYRIYRVFGIKGAKAKLRVSEPTAQLARSVLDVLSQLPNGTSADGVCISPSALTFGPEITIDVRASDD